MKKIVLTLLVAVAPVLYANDNLRDCTDLIEANLPGQINCTEEIYQMLNHEDLKGIKDLYRYAELIQCINRIAVKSDTIVLFSRKNKDVVSGMDLSEMIPVQVRSIKKLLLNDVSDDWISVQSLNCATSNDSSIRFERSKEY